MAQRHNSKRAQQNGEATGGPLASAPRAGQSDPDEPATSAEPLTRHNEEKFRDLVEAAAADGDLDEFLVERDYWMCQVATELIIESKRYPGSYTSMGGGSLLSLAGITERLSEDVDISVTFVDGADACSSNQSKRLMEECQANVEEKLGIRGAHYDIYCLIKWLRTNGMLDADASLQPSNGLANRNASCDRECG